MRAHAGRGELGRQQGVFPGGGSTRSMMNTTAPATVHPGGHGIVTAMSRGGYGCKELIGGGLRGANRAGVSAVRLGSIPAMLCSPELGIVAEDG